jgi:anaerobic magnesium-protoporphyrin IX monomethyl ester cyclase
MNVLLVRPQYDTYYKSAGFPIGIAYLAAVLEKAGHSVSLIDLVLAEDWEKELRSILSQGSFNLLGISCMSVQYAGACRTARLAKAVSQKLPIVFGGAYPSIIPEEALAHEFVDFVIRGEGEYPLRSLVSAIEQKSDFSQVPSLSYKTDGKIIQNPLLAEPPHPDDLPFPAYHLLPMGIYFQMEIPGFPTHRPNPLQIFTSRGCPYRCIYCHDMFGKRFRPRSVNNVLAEMRFLYDNYGVREFLIYDDNFTFDLQRASEICRGIVASGMEVGLQFPNGVRADRVDEPLLKDMIAAGTHSLAVGIESGSPRVQRLIRKKLSLEKTTLFLEQTHRQGLVTHGLFILGFPGETVSDVWQTIRYARRSELDFAFFTFATPYPATELHRIVMEQGLNLQMMDNALDLTIPHIITREISLRKLRRLYFMAYFFFYSRPRRLAHLVRNMFRPSLLRKYWQALWKYFIPAFRRPSTHRS